jgi:ABA responsive element binding factor
MPSSGGAISRQGSLCSLTLSDVEGQLHGLRAAAGPRRTVDEVWRDIQGAASCARPQPAQMTLEDFLSRSGGGSAVVAAAAGGGGGGGGWATEQYNPPPPVPEQQQRHSIGRPLPRPLGVGAGPVLLDALYHDHHDVAAAMSGRKRAAAATAAGGPVEKTVERRKKRMIKNRESAARSRARKQVGSSSPSSNPKSQQVRLDSAPHTVQFTHSLAWIWLWLAGLHERAGEQDLAAGGGERAAQESQGNTNNQQTHFSACLLASLEKEKQVLPISCPSSPIMFSSSS